MSLGYDPELPAGLQDADLEMADLQRAANRDAQLRKADLCTHTWFAGPPGRPDFLCHHCGETFPTLRALEESAEANADQWRTA